MPIQSANVGFGPGGVEAITPLPLRILVAADFLGRRLAVGEAAQPQLARVDKDNLEEVLGRFAPHLLFEAPNHLGGRDKTLVVDLTARRFEDLRPEAVATAQPACAALLALRGRIEKLAADGLPAGRIAAELASEIAQAPGGDEILAVLEKSAPTPAQAPSTGAGKGSENAGGGSVLDDILSASESGKAPGDAGSALGSVIGSIAGGKRTPGASAAAAALAWIDERVGRQLDAILHDPAFVAVERAWRGLRFLVARTDFRQGIVMEILPTAKDDLRPLLVQGAMDQEYNQPGDPALSVILVDHAFDRSARDIDVLQEICQAAERLQTPVIADVDPGFLGRPSLGTLGATASLLSALDGPEFAKWKGLRQTEPARWLALCVNRVLLRRPWGEKDTPVKGFCYKEKTEEKTGGGLVWGGGMWAMGSCIARSQAKHGWPIFVSGQRQDGMVEDLPLRAWEARPGTVVQISLETGLSDMQAQELSMAGLMALQCGANTDSAFFTYVPSAHAPKRFSDSGATQDSAMKAILPYQLYAGRVAAFLTKTLWEGAGGASPEELAARLRRKALELLATDKGPAPADCVLVKVGDSPKNPMRYLVTFEIRPTFKLFNMTPRLELNAEMAK